MSRACKIRRQHCTNGPIEAKFECRALDGGNHQGVRGVKAECQIKGQRKDALSTPRE